MEYNVVKCQKLRLSTHLKAGLIHWQKSGHTKNPTAATQKKNDVAAKMLSSCGRLVNDGVCQLASQNWSNQIDTCHYQSQTRLVY